jgi:hypothetical protein
MPVIWTPQSLVTPSSPYTYQTFLQVRQSIALRLSDTGNVFWTDPEIALYLLEALYTWNALTGFWVTRQITTLNVGSPNWIPVNSIGSARIYTQQDTNIYPIILYHLLESQLSAGVWGGTTQFSLADMTQAVDRRQAEIVQFCQLNLSNVTPYSVLAANQRTFPLGDTILDIMRARAVPPSGSPQTLSRGDSTSFALFSPSYRQSPQMPRNYSLSAQFPLTLEVDYPPIINIGLDMIQGNSPTVTAMPTPVPLAIPDDWTWVLKWGVMMDMLGKQSEAQDIPRQQYCKARYAEGIQLMTTLPWLMEALFNEVPVNIEAVAERDTFDNGWETNSTTRQSVIVAGIDLVSIAPRPTGGTNLSLSLKVVQSAPIPVLNTDIVQVPRDVLDVIIDYCVHLAAFKMGGAEFSDTIPLFDNFRTIAKAYNQRLSQLGLFDDMMKAQGNRQSEVDPRYISV